MSAYRALRQAAADLRNPSRVVLNPNNLYEDEDGSDWCGHPQDAPRACAIGCIDRAVYETAVGEVPQIIAETEHQIRQALSVSVDSVSGYLTDLLRDEGANVCAAVLDQVAERVKA